jgi:hypothetical protein
MSQFLVGLYYPENGGRYIGELNGFHYFVNETSLHNGKPYLRNFYYDDYFWPNDEEANMMRENYPEFRSNCPHNVLIFTKTLRKIRG